MATTPTTAADADGAGTASRPLTDTVVGVLTPVTGTVQAITDARPTAAVVEAIDGLLGVLPVTGDLLGDDTLGTITRPVTGVTDDLLGGVGSTVGTLPGTVGTVVSPVEGALPIGPLPVPTLP
ncbi:hypothetical protein, partial [Curtobacterium sp. UCD-KPL2560]|uniref:hypothetical protein n=1 Tax=Curtobacterium sp. UCD-KPL2560 TaxID=1885315 RepID=UPI001C0AEE6B